MKRRIRPLALAALLFAGAAALAISRHDEAASPSRDSTASAVEQYEQQLAAAAQEGGFVVEIGMKAAMARLGAGQSDGALLAAVGWVRQLEHVRLVFDRAARPLALEPAAKEFDRSFVFYARAARTIGAASATSGAVRTKLLREAQHLGRAADRRYDRASARLQRERRLLRLRPSHRFPDPVASR